MEGTTPEDSELLITKDIASKTSSIHSIRREVGIGSSSQVVGLQDKMIFFSSSSLIGLKFDICWPVKDVSPEVKSDTASLESNLSLIVLTLDKKTQQREREA